jgi:hypothetical protein
MHLMRWKPVAVFVFLLSISPQRADAFIGISNITPTSGPVGTVVSITGTGFGSTAGSATFNGTTATIISWSTYNVVVRVPAGATTGNVVLTIGGGGINGPSFTVTAGSPGGGYGFHRAITIDHTKVANTDQANFPVLVSGTYAYLATTANGGNVTNSNGYDIVFTSDAGGTTGLPYERESYSATTGQVNFWVQVPLVSHTTDTVIHMFYGNSSATTDQSSGPGVWDPNYVSVYHLGDNTPTTTVLNSTAYPVLNGTATANTNTKTTAGKIDGALNFNGTSDYIALPQNGNYNFNASPFTISGWMKDDTSASILDNPKHRVFSWYDGTKNFQLGFSSAASETTRVIYMFVGTSIASVSAGTTGNLSTGYHYVVGTFDGASTLHIYVDGARLDGGAFDGGVTTFTANSTTLYLGQLGSGADFVSGQLDEMRISKAVRSADWTLTEYRNQSSPSTFYSVGAASGSGGGGISYVQSQTSAVGAGANKATFSAQPAAGDTIVAGVVCYGPSGCTINSLTDNFSNSYTKIGPTATYGGPTKNITNVALYCASGISTGSGFAVTAALSNSGGDSNLYIAEYSGATCSVDQSASGSETGGSNTTLLQTSSATTTNATDLLVAVGGSSTGGAATAGSGYSLRQNGNSGVAEYGGFEDKTVTTTGSYGASMTVASNTTYWAMVMVALKSTSGGQGGGAPTITRLSPASGPVNTSVTITGTNFGATVASNTVTFANGQNAAVTSASPTILIATVPSGAITGPIVVTVGGVNSNSATFTVTSTPSGPNITNVTPTSGNGNTPATQVTISGTGFGSSQGSGLVLLGSKPGVVVTWTDTQIVATVASGATTGFVRVLQNELWSNSVPFSINLCF